MALPHAQPLDIIDIRSLGSDLRDAVTTSLIKTPTLQFMRLILQASLGLPEHSVAGAISVQCLEGGAVVKRWFRLSEHRTGYDYYSTVLTRFATVILSFAGLFGQRTWRHAVHGCA